MTKVSVSSRLTIVVCAVIAAAHVAYMAAPVGVLVLFRSALRPLIYALLAAAVFVFLGLDRRPALKAYSANMIAVLSVSIFGIVLLVVSLAVGAGRNVMVSGWVSIWRNLWEVGLIVVLGEYMRYKFIKNSNESNRARVVTALTIVLALSHMSGGLRMLSGRSDLLAVVFFETIFRMLVISAAAGYFALRGGFASALIISFVYIMTPLLSPFLPNVSPVVWALITCGMLFITMAAYRFMADDRRRSLRLREKRAAKYAPRSYSGYGFTVALILALMMFAAGVFPVYPVAVLTGSMEPAFGRGALVLVHRVPQGEAFERVGEGYVIHFRGRGGAEYIHRAMGFRSDEQGRRAHIVTKGDANPAPDIHPVPQENVLGIARAFIPFLGYPYVLFWRVRNALR